MSRRVTDYRPTEEGQNFFKEIRNKHLSLEGLLLLAISGLGIVVEEKQVITRYSETTGEPVERKWVESKKWGGLIFTHHGFTGLSCPHLSEALEKLTENGPVALQVNGAYYSVRSYATGYNGGFVTAGVVVQPLQMITLTP